MNFQGPMNHHFLILLAPQIHLLYIVKVFLRFYFFSDDLSFYAYRHFLKIYLEGHKNQREDPFYKGENDHFR